MQRQKILSSRIIEKNDLERFFKYVNKTEKCWLWVGAVTTTGYGVFNFGNMTHKAHRWIYQAVNKIILPTQQFCCHLCDNRLCVNPAHIFVGDNTDNMRDASVKGRLVRGRPTHCKHGHEFTQDNIFIDKRNKNKDHWGCVKCRKIISIKQKKAAADFYIKTGSPKPVSHKNDLCSNGHKIQDSNVYLHKMSGQRRCRRCAVDRTRLWRQRNRDKNNKRKRELRALQKERSQEVR